MEKAAKALPSRREYEVFRVFIKWWDLVGISEGTPFYGVHRAESNSKLKRTSLSRLRLANFGVKLEGFDGFSQALFKRNSQPREPVNERKTTGNARRK